MQLAIFTKNMMTEGGPAKAHSIGRVSAERDSTGWTVQVDHHGTQEQAERQAGVVWQTYYLMPFDVDLGVQPYQAAAAWLIANESAFSGGVPLTISEQTQIEEPAA
ncbi:hypothetical protein [Alcaligenes aquatilis]|uniref:hypothetical protein n=1 Tax=Alcaligenes aquatilis TaxID=323284 RepID=UPI000D52D874|nr:hypothetical protein [Alcaligenes aquatilis]AWG34027.1 hypothetical protein CA948_02240 [Alcaligenes aquatilis]